MAGSPADRAGRVLELEKEAGWAEIASLKGLLELFYDGW